MMEEVNDDGDDVNNKDDNNNDDVDDCLSVSDHLSVCLSIFPEPLYNVLFTYVA